MIDICNEITDNLEFYAQSKWQHFLNETETFSYKESVEFATTLVSLLHERKS